ncbi:MAG: PA14 domain-containing protein, partial [Pseudomonadota bacterium]
DHEEAASLEIDVTVTDAAGASLTETFTINVAPSMEVHVESGFHARYFDVDTRLARIDDVNWDAEPTFSEVTQDINYANGRGSFWEGGDTDTFATEVTGTIEVTEPGTFDFYLSADDGAQLYINGVPVVDNDGLHGYRTREGEIELEPGLHHIEVRYFENTGHAGLRLEWDGPGTDGRSLVEPAGGDEVHAVSGTGTPLVLSFPDGGPSDGISFMVEGLPEGTVIEAGAREFIVDSSGVVDLTGSETEILNVQTPVGFSGTIEASVVLEYLGGEDQGGAESRFPLDIEVREAQLPEVNLTVTQGFTATYFDVNTALRSTDDIDWEAAATHSEVIEAINYTNSGDSFWEGGSRDTFGVKVEGEILVETGGTYTFYAGADDGVVVFVNGKAVVENDGLHGFRTRSGEIELEPGTYDIEVRYFENYGHAGLKLEWDGPDTDGRELVQPHCDFEIDPNGTLDVGLFLDGATADAQFAISGLPSGTLINSGEDAAIVDDQPVDVSGWNLASIQISPPPSFEGQIDGTVQVSDTAFNGARVTGEHDFAFTVGDVAADIGQEQIPQALLEFEAGKLAGDWTIVGDVEENNLDDDVMSEAVEHAGVADAASVALEVYDRFEA